MIETAAVGLALGPHDTTVTVRRMLAYAAGIGDVSARVFDDAAPGFIAHPAMCVALEWPVVSDPSTAAALVPDPQDRGRAVHLIQDSCFHHPIRAGDRVTTAGEVTGVWRGAAGVRTASLLRTVDARGRRLVTSRAVAVYRGVDATGPDQPPPDDATLPAPPAEGAGPHIELALDIDPALPHRYTECTGIWNPIHTERRIARAAGLPDPVLHGTATWALAGTAITARLAGGDAARLRRLRGRFGALVLPGSRLRLDAVSQHDAEGTHVHFTVRTPSGELAIADGYALLADPAEAT